MTKYLVEMKEIVTYSYYVDATSSAQAEFLATAQYQDGPGEPSSVDYDETRVYVETSLGSYESVED